MKILLVADFADDPRFGSAKVTSKLRHEFAALGHRCDALYAGDLGEWPRNRHLRGLLSPILAFRAISLALRQNGPYDVIDIASAEGLYVGLLRRLKLKTTCPVIARSNGLEHLNYKRMIDDHHAGLIHKPIWKRIWHPTTRLSQVEWAARLADRLILLNPSDRDFVCRKGWKESDAIDLISHGVSEQFLNHVPPSDSPRGGGILYCGTWTEVKGVHYLAGAFARLVEHGIKVNLTILGGSVPEVVIRSSFPHAAQPFLTIIDRLPEQEVMQHYRRHDLLVFPSTYEGFGMVLLEAMSQRLPVVTTPVGAAISMVRHDENGWVVPPRNSDLLAEAIFTLLSDPELRIRLSERAFQEIQSRTWEQTARETLRVYEKAVLAV